MNNLTIFELIDLISLCENDITETKALLNQTELNDSLKELFQLDITQKQKLITKLELLKKTAKY